jgi:hypothetical protein
VATQTADPLLDGTAEDEHDDQETGLEPNADAGELFDRSQYDREDLAIPKVDGKQIDKIRVSFGGSVLLDRSAPADVALFNRLTLGHDVELRVSGKVGKSSTGFTTNREGDLDAIVGDRALRIDSVWILDPEDL